MRRGYTLIEIMIVVAIIGISVGVLGSVATQERLAAGAELQRERARELLEYEADCLSSGRAVEAAIVSELQGTLPELKLSTRRDGPLVTVSAQWKSATAKQEALSLSVFAKGQR